MFSSQGYPELPTWAKFRKELDEACAELHCDIERILFGEKFRSITFMTEQFRYSVKFDDEVGYSEAVEALRALETKPHVIYFHWMKADNTADVHIQTLNSADEAANLTELDLSFIRKLKFFSWGFIVEKSEPPKLSLKDKSRRSGRFSNFPAK